MAECCQSSLVETKTCIRGAKIITFFSAFFGTSTSICKRLSWCFFATKLSFNVRDFFCLTLFSESSSK